MTSSPDPARAPFGGHAPCPPRTTARHNLATSFTRALSELDHPRIATALRHHARNNQSPNVLCIRSTMSNSQKPEVRSRKSELPTPITRLQFLFISIAGKKMVGQGRFELPTSRLSSARSNQLSYKPEIQARDSRNDRVRIRADDGTHVL